MEILKSLLISSQFLLLTHMNVFIHFLVFLARHFITSYFAEHIFFIKRKGIGFNYFMSNKV